MPIECTNSPLSGLWKPQQHLKHLYYGSGCVDRHLISILPGPPSRVFIITGSSIFTKTPLIQQLQALLGDQHAGTFASIKQHGQASDIDEATSMVVQDSSVDTLISVGGGSPIDAAKTICYSIHGTRGKFLAHVAIPTTLSAAECTAGGGFTRADGTKVGFMHPCMGVSAIFYDASFARYTPQRLWLATGMRAIDHAVETMYHPNASEMPWKALACWALEGLTKGLPVASQIHGTDEADDVTTALQLAAFASSGLRGSNFGGGMGLSHSLGHALGSPYGIPHGETSCLTLAPVIRHKVATDPVAASQVARLLPLLGGERRLHSSQADALEVARRIEELVATLGLTQPPLSTRGVGREQVDVIAVRAAGQNPPELVVKLVEGLF